MARSSRPWGVVAGPVILVVGIAAFYGIKSAAGWSDRVQDWAYQLEHSAAPVVMEIPEVPVLSRLYIDDHHVGRIDKIVVQRQAPRAVDSLTIIVNVNTSEATHLKECTLKLDIRGHGLVALRQALHCAEDTDQLVRFGSVQSEDNTFTFPLVVGADDLPCGSKDFTVTACARADRGLTADARALRRQLQRELREVRVVVP